MGRPGGADNFVFIQPPHPFSSPWGGREGLIFISFSGLYVLSVHVAADAGYQDDVYRRHAEHPYGKGAGYRNPAVGERYLGALGHVERGHGYQSHHSWAYAAEYGRHNLVVLELMEEHGDGQNDEKRRQGRAQGHAQGAAQLAQAVAYEGADVYRHHARTALGNGYHVDELLTAEPLVLVDHLALDERYHGVAAAEGEQADLEKRLETVDVKVGHYVLRKL